MVKCGELRAYYAASKVRLKVVFEWHMTSSLMARSYSEVASFTNLSKVQVLVINTTFDSHHMLVELSIGLGMWTK